MKKVILLLLCALLLSACGNNVAGPEVTGVPSSSTPAATAAPAPSPTESAKPEKTPAPEQITLNVMLCRDVEEGFVQRFEEENPGVRLELEVLASGEFDAAGDLPDLLMLGAFADYVKENLLLPAEAYCPEDLYADFLPALLDQSAIDGTVWALPAMAGEYVMYCNAALLKEAGAEVPETWAELETAAQAILDHFNGADEIYPWGVDLSTGAGEVTFACYAYNNGGGFFDAQGRWTLNSDANVEALEYVISLVDRGFTNPAPSTQNLSDLQEMFMSGRLAMLIAPRQFPAAWEAAGSKSADGVGFVTAPIPHAEGNAPAAVGTLDYLMAFRDDAAPDQDARNEAIGSFLRFYYDSSETIEPLLLKFLPTARPEWLLVKQGLIFAEQNALIGGEVRAELDALQMQLEE